MDLQAFNEESIVKLVANLSYQLSLKFPSFNKNSNVNKKTELFKTAYEVLLNKRRSDFEDHRSDYPLDELLIETYYFISCRNKAFMNKDIAERINCKINRLGELARNDSDTLCLVKSMLRFLLLLNDHLPKRNTKGILKYKEPVWFASRPSDKIFLRPSSQPSDLNIRSMMCIRKNDEFSPFSENLGKLKKSATWHEGVMNALTSSHVSASSSFARPRSQTGLSMDEGFVTPDDIHREITPEPHRKSKLEPGWWCNWEVLGSPPSQYKTWESQWIYPVQRETQDLLSFIEPSYNNSRVDSILKGGAVPAELSYLIEPEQLIKDIVCLLSGLPSSTFKLTEDDSFKLVDNAYMVGVMPSQLIRTTAPFIKFAETYRNIESFVNKNRRYDQVIPQALHQSLHNYLFQLKSLIMNSANSNKTGNMELSILEVFALKPLAHLQFIWRLIEKEKKGACHRVLERMYSSLAFIHDDELLCFINVIILNCCYQYVSFFEKMINTGTCAEELKCEGTGSVSVEKVPYFLRSLADVINNSTKTLQLLHKDPKMSLLKTKVLSKKTDIPLSLAIDPHELVKQHYIKFMKEKQEEKAKLADKKAVQMSKILDDIEAKQKWKELEEMQRELKERKILERYDKLDSIKQKYLDECKKDVETKYDNLIRESDKKIAIANWKLKRLVGSNARSEIIKNSDSENHSIKQDFKIRGIDLSTQNKELIAAPVHVATVEIDPIVNDEGEETDEMDAVTSRHDEAAAIKKKMMDGVGDWKYNEYGGGQTETSERTDKVDLLEGQKVYEENRSKALAIKKKIMSSELEIETPPIQHCFAFRGLSEIEKQNLAKNLTVFTAGSDVADHCSHFNASYEFLNQKSRVRDFIRTQEENKFHDGVLNFIEMRHSFLKSAETYLKKEVEFANKIMLDQLKDDFVNEVRWIMNHYLLADAIWARRLARGLVTMMRQGTISPGALNRLLPNPLSVKMNRPQPPAFDPSDPSTVDFLFLFYRPAEPLSHFITERFLLRYNQNFLLLIKIEQACWMLNDAVKLLRIKSVPSSSKHCLQYNQIHFHIYVMNHFIISMKTFISVAFEKCWNKFFSDADVVVSLDDLHNKHICFLTNSQFYCLLKKKSSSLYETLLKLIKYIYKYCETLRCGIISINTEGDLVHSLFKGLVQHFKNFLVNARFLYAYLVRLIDAGRANAFSDLREMLSANDFYSQDLK